MFQTVPGLDHPPTSCNCCHRIGAEAIANVFAATADSATAIRTDGLKIATKAHGLPIGTAVLWSIWPERIGLVDRAGPDRCACTVLDSADLGLSTLVRIRPDDGPELERRTSIEPENGASEARPGWVHLGPAAVSVWPAG